MQAPKDWGGLRTTNATTDDGGGAAPDQWSCEPRPMALVDPPPACQRDLRLLKGGTEEVRGGGNKRVPTVVPPPSRDVTTLIQELDPLFHASKFPPETFDVHAVPRYVQIEFSLFNDCVDGNRPLIKFWWPLLVALLKPIPKVGKGGGPVIALVKRGVCTFVEKAKNVQLAILNNGALPEETVTAPPPPRRPTIAASEDGGITITTAAAAAAGAEEGKGGVGAGGASATTMMMVGGGMVLLNGDDSLADMPAGNLLTDDISIPVAM